MGVRGLQSFLKDNRQSLCRSLVLDTAGAEGRGRVPVVVDAWGIIYQLYLDALPWASGGEYFQFYRLVRRLIKAWRSVGLDPVFVFDGASPPEKHTTLLSRMQQSVETARLFYTTRPESRSTPSGQRGGNSVLPPFTSQTFAAALSSMGVETRFAPRGEADGVCVALAAELGGYVMGRDTDFVILATGADAMRGYIPLDMVEWTEGTPPSPTSSQAGGDGGGFTTVSSSRRARGRTLPHSRLLPPRQLRNPTLVLPTFTAPALARRLRLPPAMLPLLASLVGNDYASADLSNGGKPADRIDRIARVLRETQARPRTASGGHAETAYDLVARVVRKLHIRPYVDERELAATVDAAVDATIHYVLPPPMCCAVYPFCGELDPAGCQNRLSGTGTPTEDGQTEVGGAGGGSARGQAARAYAEAQRRGYLNLVTHVWLHPDRVYMWGVLENPNGPSARAARLPTAARRAAYAIVDEALGLRWPAVSEEEREARRQDREAAALLSGLSVAEEEDEDEDEGDDDEADDQEEGGGSDAGSAGSTPAANGVPSDTDEDDDTPRRVVVEYLRQGSSTRIAARELALPPPSEAGMPTALLPLEARLTAYRDALDCPPSVASVPVSLQPLAAALRLCVLSAAESDPTGHQGRRWRRTEVEAVLRAAIGCAEGWEAANDEEPEREEEGGEWDDTASMASVGTTAGGDNYPVLTNRAAELVAEFSAAMLDTMALAQALLLLPPSARSASGSKSATSSSEGADDSSPTTEGETTPSSPGLASLTHLTPYVFISGSAVHSLLAGNEPPASCGWRWSAAWKHKLHRALDAVLDGAEEMLAAPMSPKRRKAKLKPSARAGGASGMGGGGGAKAAGGQGGSRFDLLMSEDM